jgi:hypothetical protein
MFQFFLPEWPTLFFFVVAVIGLVIALLVLITTIFRWLWNITMPEAFGLKPIRFWIAFRLLLIASILTGAHWITFSSK